MIRRAVPVLLGIVALMVVLRLAGGGSAPVPAVFAETQSLDDAMTTANASGQVVLVLATADWCVPCKKMKRGPLREDRVTAAIRARAVPVYLDVTSTKDEAAMQAAQRLGVEGIPALIALRRGQEVGRLVGYHGADEVVRFIERF